MGSAGKIFATMLLHLKIIVDLLKTVLIQISCLLLKPADQDPHCFPYARQIHIDTEYCLTRLTGNQELF